MDVGRRMDGDAEVDDVTQERAEGLDGDEATLWEEWDADFDREEGPFDIGEVDLEADEVKRLDLGTLVITPFDKMNLQLQVDKAKEKVQALLISDGTSAMEVAVFAGPTRSSMLGEIREEIIKATAEANGTVEVVSGPFGAELRRHLPVTTPDGQPATHMSRTWLTSGPGWVLRGVVMGKAALEPDNQDADLAMWEFFTNLVVRRGPEPAAPGSVLHMEIPQLDEQ
ncbi:MAG: DUF3710 domain-containing protein [Arachnia sp.]